MSNYTYLNTWNEYQAAWADIPAEQRESLLVRSVAPDAVYTDPQSECHGMEQLLQRIQQTQAAFPGCYFRNDKAADHHRQALFWWTMFSPQHKVIATGTSFARFREDGLLTQMTGFFELA